MSVGDELRKSGWTPVFESYPPFYKRVEIFFPMEKMKLSGSIVMSGSNKVCLYADNKKYYDLDKYIALYWKIS